MTGVQTCALPISENMHCEGNTDSETEEWHQGDEVDARKMSDKRSSSVVDAALPSENGDFGSGSKFLIPTCILWLTLGWFGAHHFYLGRDRHGFVWLVTLGGGFGVGWLAEIWRLPEYVRAANRGGRSVGGSTEEGHRPPVSWERILGELIFSMYLAGTSVLMTAALMKTCWLAEIIGAHPFIHPVLPLCVGAFSIAAGEICMN